MFDANILFASNTVSLFPSLSGIFPQDEYPEEVSTDEDDDMFGSRKRMKRPAHNEGVKEKGIPAGKKSKADTG